MRKGELATIFGWVNDGRSVEGMREYLGNMIMQPFGALFAVKVTVVAVVVRGHVLEDIVHPLCLDVGEQRLYEAFVDQIREVGRRWNVNGEKSNFTEDHSLGLLVEAVVACSA